MSGVAFDDGISVPWYHRPLWVLVLLFVVLGPLALPYLWRSPRFSRGMKALLTALVLAWTVLLVEQAIDMVRAVRRQLNDLDSAMPG